MKKRNEGDLYEELGRFGTVKEYGKNADKEGEGGGRIGERDREG